MNSILFICIAHPHACSQPVSPLIIMDESGSPVDLTRKTSGDCWIMIIFEMSFLINSVRDRRQIIPWLFRKWQIILGACMFMLHLVR